MSPIISIFSNDGELARYLSMMCCWSYDHLITLMHGNCYLPVNQIRTSLQQKHTPYIAGSETPITPILIVHQCFPFTIPNPHVFIGNKHAANISNHPHIIFPSPLHMDEHRIPALDEEKIKTRTTQIQVQTKQKHSTNRFIHITPTK